MPAVFLFFDHRKNLHHLGVRVRKTAR